MSAAKSILIALLALPLSGCAVLWFHDVDEKAPPIVPPPEGYSRSGTERLPDQWWQSFGDSSLNKLVDSVLEGNLDLRRAWARLDQAAAILDGAESAYFPEITASADIRRNQQAFPFNDLKVLNTSYPLSVGASYELDLWGRVRSTAKAADFDFAASRNDLESAAMTLAAQVTETWFGLLEQQAQLELIREQIASNETVLELVELRFQQGMSSALDVYQQRQLLVGSKAQLPLVESRLEVFRHQLAVLVGRAPTDDVAGNLGMLPELPPFPETGVPAALIERRPDVRAAQLRVAAADYRVAAAIANRFPTVRLSASAGFNAFWPDSPFTNFVWSLAGGLVAPLFDGGKRKAEQKRSEAVVEDLVAGYGQAVLIALREVEDAMVQEEKQRLHLEQVKAQTEVATASLREARDRYLSGLSDYLPVLTALSTLQNAQRNEITARRQLLSYRVQLCRALGGEWTNALESPSEEREQTPQKDSQT